jgi:di/tricarboxylate transporter
MTREILVVLGILTGAILLFLSNRVRPDVVAVLVAVALAVTNSVTTQEALSGFSSPAVIAIAALLVIGAALVRTGVVQCIAGCLQGLAGESQGRLKVLSGAVPGVLSGFVNIIASVSLFVPTLLRLARRAEVPASALLLPMAATALVGANLTLIGAGHNLVVSNLLAEGGHGAFSFFEFAPAGVVLLALTLIYNWVLGPRLLPKDKPASAFAEEPPDDLVLLYRLEDFLWEVWVKPGSDVIGRSVGEVGIGREYGLSLISITRAKEVRSIHKGGLEFQEDDVLLLGGRQERVEQLCREHSQLLLRGHPKTQEPFPSSNAELIEVMVAPRSPVVGQTLRELDFRRDTGLTAVGLWRDGVAYRTDVTDRPLQEGDAILLFGDRTRTRHFQPAPGFKWTQSPPEEEAPPELRHLGPWAAAVLAGVVIVAAIGWMSIATAALAGAAGMVLMRILPPEKLYASVDWRSIVLIAGMFPLGIGLQKSGAAELVADLLVRVGEPFGWRAVLLAVGILSVLLTQVLHNAAVAVIMTPVAIDTATALNANPKAFGVAVVLGASAAFLMPVGHPALLMVQGPGNYSTRDYAKYGAGLVLLTLLVLWFMVPLIWKN